MPDSDLGTDVVINAADGTEKARWKKITPHEFLSLSRAVKRIRKRECAENLRANGVEGEAAVASLNACDARIVDYTDTISLVNQLDGQAEVLLLAIRRNNPGAPDSALDDLGLNPWEWQKPAAALLNVELQEVKEPGASPLPGAASGSVPTASGTAKPIG